MKQQDFSRPEIKNESDAFYRYLYFVFFPAVIKLGAGKIGDESMSGCLYWCGHGRYNQKPFDTVYATPLWDGEMNSISIGFYDSESGSYIADKIDFPFNNWTMDAEIDARRYYNAVKSYLQTKTDNFAIWWSLGENREDKRISLTSVD